MADHADSLEVVRNRILPRVAGDILAWVQRRCLPGGPFAFAGHAMEVGLQRLFEEHRFVKQECRRLELAFADEAFWSHYATLIEASRPAPVGRPQPGQQRSTVERHVTNASIDVRLLEWADKQVASGRFETPGHLIETGLRHLRTLDVEPAWAGQGFPMNPAKRWRSYEKASKQP